MLKFILIAINLLPCLCVLELFSCVEHCGNKTMTGQFDNIFFLFAKTIKMQMMNRRPDSENGCTVKSPTQEAVMGEFNSYVYRLLY